MALRRMIVAGVALLTADGLNWMPLNQNNPVATPTAGMQTRNQHAVIYSANNGTRDVFMVNYSAGSDLTARQDATFQVTY
ncbi:hypothetical protein ACTWPT_40415 [Nonomuraea sp. 3N208]|uniref:hypothetical protein n=1 Tax=Nonomuraea sp. 3N208 TaxID=3457421 RepID=UPI003FD02ED4